MVNLVSGMVFFQANFTKLKNIFIGKDGQFKISQLTDLEHNCKKGIHNTYSHKFPPYLFSSFYPFNIRQN
jgi:hypothetical protein